MAVAVIGGVISSTLLTLVVVPAAYGYILKLEMFVRRFVNRWLPRKLVEFGSRRIAPDHEVQNTPPGLHRLLAFDV